MNGPAGSEAGPTPRVDGWIELFDPDVEFVSGHPTAEAALAAARFASAP